MLTSNTYGVGQCSPGAGFRWVATVRTSRCPLALIGSAYWGGPPLGVQNLHTFPTPKTGIKHNMSPGLRKKRKMRKMLFWDFWSFQFQSRWQGVWDFWGFWGFQITMQFTDELRFWDFWGFQFQSHWQGVWDFFCPTGTRDTIILLEGVPKQVATKGPAIIPRKALRILVRICSQVPAKVQSALLGACERGEGRGSPKTNNASKDQNKTEQCDAQSWQNDPLPTQTQKKASRQQCRSRISTSPAAKACDNNTQTIPNNLVLWQRRATCRRGWRHWISNGVPRDPAILLDLQKHCGLLKPC